MRTWIIGAGGLLGSALARKSDHSHISRSIPWNDPESALEVLQTELARFLATLAHSPGEEWAIIWAAGRVSTASRQDEVNVELATYSAFISMLAAAELPSRGCFAIASSAGGVYSGSARPPFSSTTSPLPTGAYGRLKMAQEQLASDSLASQMRVLHARIANLYGPGQDLRKLQGFISRLAWSAISKEQVNVFVSLDTLRDYIFVDDAAALLLHWVEESLQPQERSISVRVIASGEPISLGYLINLVQDVTRTRIPIAYGSHESAQSQARDLRLSPDEDSFTRSLTRTQLPAGVKAVYQDLLQRRQSSQLAATALG